MDWTAFRLSLDLAVATCLILLPLALLVGRWLAWTRIRGRSWIEALIALPLVLPPTVLGYYVLVGLGMRSPLGRAAAGLLGHPLPFSFAGLLVASLLVNLPFAIQPVQRAFEAIPAELREAAAVCGSSAWRTFGAIELRLAWPGVVSAAALTLAHTMGEYGVVLMVGGNIPGQTKTVAVAIYDRAQAFDTWAAGVMSATLLLFSLVTIGVVYSLAGRPGVARAG